MLIFTRQTNIRLDLNSSSRSYVLLQFWPILAGIERVLSTVTPVMSQLVLYYYNLMKRAMSMLSNISVVHSMKHNDAGQQLKERHMLLFGQSQPFGLIYLGFILLSVLITQQQLLSKLLGSQNFSAGVLPSLNMTLPLNIDQENAILMLMHYLVYP